MIYLTTYFDKNYLSRGLVLYNSLKEYNADFTLYILCLDEFTQNYFNSKKSEFPNVITLQLSEIEENENELIAAKNNRSKIEYYFTLSPCLPLYLLKKYNLPHICSLDADILFCDSPEVIFEKLTSFSIIITPHKFSKELLHLDEFGKYNVSFQIFKNDEIGIKCLEYWKTQCIEWCGDEYDEINNRFADQKYLDNWLNLYPNSVYVLNDNVSGLAPWNLNNYDISLKNNQFYSNNERIIFYHFHHFKLFSEKWATNGFREYSVKTKKGIDLLYFFYWKKLELFNKILNVSNDVSTRFDITSEDLAQKILKERKLYLKKKNKLSHFDIKPIPKFLRNIYIKLYA